MLGAPQDVVTIPRRVHPTAEIHPLAHVQRTVNIGAGTKVWQFASVIRNAQIGQDCTISANAIVDGSIVGDGCVVGHSASIHPGMVIGNDVFIGPLVSLCNDYWPRVCKTGWYDIDELTSGLVEVTHIKDGASIGASAIIMPGVVIGESAMVAAGSVVTGDVPANHLWKRNGEVEPIRLLPERRRACSL